MLPFYEIQTKDLRLYRRTRQLSFPAHMHSSIEIMYVFSGVQYVEVDGVPYAIHEGEAAFIFPDIVHRYERQEDQPVDAVLMISTRRGCLERSCWTSTAAIRRLHHPKRSHP